MDRGRISKKMEGSVIRRIGHIRWLRNIAVTLGNSNQSTEAIKALLARQTHSSDIVKEHVNWALKELDGSK